MTTPEPEPPAERARGPLVALVRLYPRAWQQRYGDELRELLVTRAPTVPGVLALLRGAWDAHLHLPDLLPDQGRPQARLRWSLTLTLACWVAFVLAAGGVAKSTEDPAFVHAAAGHAALGVTWALAGAALLVAGLGVAAGAAVLAVPAVLQACRRRDGVAFALLVVPPAAVAVVLGSLVLLARLHPGPPRSPGTVALVGGWLVLLLLGVVTAVRAAAGLLRRTALSRRALRLAGAAAALTAGAMTVGVAAGAAYGVALWAQAPSLFSSDDGLLSTALPATWAAALLVAVGAVAVANRTVLRAARTGPRR